MINLRLQIGSLVVFDLTLLDDAEDEDDQSTTQLGGGAGTVITEVDSFEAEFVQPFGFRR